MSRGRAAQAEGTGKTHAEGARMKGVPVVRGGWKMAEMRGRESLCLKEFPFCRREAQKDDELRHQDCVSEISLDGN